MKSIKLVASVLVICLALGAYGQSKITNGKIDIKDVKIENISIKVEVDSAKELKSTLKIDDFEEILDETQLHEVITFELKCNGEPMSNVSKASMSYTIKGNTNNKAEFLQGITKIRTAAIKYYNSQN